MAAKFLMQALRVDGALVTWRAPVPDWSADFAPHDSYSDLALAGGGFLTPAGASDGQVITASGARVLTASGASVVVAARPGVLTASGARVLTAGGARVTI